MSLASFALDYVFDPIGTLIERALGSSDPAVATAAPAAAAAASPAPMAAAPNLVTDLETAINTAIDAVIANACGHIPLIGELLEPEAVKLANEGLAYVEQHVGAYAAGLVAAVTAKIVSAV
ncbi:MAG TPA: hypothetical protein VFC47_11240 [Caulobacteraceae bacterium]|nr:hypothetical protein [Caulobacteraceae bacterium]